MIKRITQYIIRWVQSVLITALLTVLYIVGFGITALVVAVFRPSLLRKETIGEETFWQHAEGYDTHWDDTQRQS